MNAITIFERHFYTRIIGIVMPPSLSDATLFIDSAVIASTLSFGCCCRHKIAAIVGGHHTVVKTWRTLVWCARRQTDALDRRSQTA
jgi:hypothetical protein